MLFARDVRRHALRTKASVERMVSPSLPKEPAALYWNAALVGRPAPTFTYRSLFPYCGVSEKYKLLNGRGTVTA